MPKVKITNLKSGACVINSLGLTIAGNSSVTRDASVVGDSDLTELESYGVVAVTPIEDIRPQTPQPVPQPVPQPAKPVNKSPASKTKNNKKPPQPQQPKIQQPLVRAGTDFRAVDGPEDNMGGKAVVVGEHGPEVRKMNGGINTREGPRFTGDDAWQESDPSVDEGFTTL